MITDDDDDDDDDDDVSGQKLLFPNKETAALLIRISFEFSSPIPLVHTEDVKHLTCHFAWSEDSLTQSAVFMCDVIFFSSSGGHNPYMT